VCVKKIVARAERFQKGVETVVITVLYPEVIVVCICDSGISFHTLTLRPPPTRA
jgi:hypothetical protein